MISEKLNPLVVPRIQLTGSMFKKINLIFIFEMTSEFNNPIMINYGYAFFFFVSSRSKNNLLNR